MTGKNSNDKNRFIFVANPLRFTPSNFSNMLTPRQAVWARAPALTMPPIIYPVAPPKTVQISFEKEKGNWQRDFFRALAAGIAVPVATLPLEKIETQVTVRRGFKVACAATLENPWSGFKFKAGTNVLRTFLLFNTTAYARDYFQKPGKSQLQVELQACSTAAVVEGTVMSFKTPIMQKLQTDKTAGVAQVLQKAKRAEFYKAWRVACFFGVMRDLTFWPLWIIAVEAMKASLLVERQPETPIKLWEQFMIGSTAAIVVSPLSFPAHGLMRRLLDEKCVAPNIIHGLKMDFHSAWYSHKAMGQPAWKFVSSHVYRGFIPAAVVILPLNMGLTNLFKHIADVGYDHYCGHTLFMPVKPQPIDKNEILYEYLKNSI